MYPIFFFLRTKRWFRLALCIIIISWENNAELSGRTSQDYNYPPSTVTDKETHADILQTYLTKDSFFCHQETESLGKKWVKPKCRDPRLLFFIIIRDDLHCEVGEVIFFKTVKSLTSLFMSVRHLSSLLVCLSVCLSVYLSACLSALNI